MAELGEGVDRRDRPAPGRKRPVRIRITMCFDGTLNNRENTNARVQRATAQARAAYRAHGGGETSYENDKSNVARLEEQLGDTATECDLYLHVYVEGIGTTNFGGDSQMGYALGVGGTGVEAKVSKGIAAAVEAISSRRDISSDDTMITRLTVDTCGFSRGAAAARNCVYRVLHNEYGPEGVVLSTNLKETLEGDGWTVGQVLVHAVGLFDTVSSHGVAYWNDVFELRLDAIREAAAVYHLAAAEEYRNNFSLTDIRSAGGKGRQVYLPGAHSDVGGSYVDRAGEDRVLSRDSAAHDVGQFLLQRGWYHNGPRGKELEYDVQEYSDPNTGIMSVTQTLKGHRASIRQAYSFIPLHLMADFFRSQGLRFDDSNLNTSYDPKDVPGRARIEQDAKAGRATSPTHWEGIDPVLAQLRHDYLHISFKASIGLTVRTENVGSFFNPRYQPVRKVYHG